MSLDKLQRAYYDVAFERDFLKKRGNAFQDFFCEIMEKCHPADFMRVRPWGNVGDRKNDGYLPSQRILFQVYAPNEMKATEATSKIDEDFNGALQYWQAYFDKWCFVHNSREGLGPDVTRILLDLDRSNPISVVHWGFEELRQKTFTLCRVDIASLLGEAPSGRAMLDLGFTDLQPVIAAIAREAQPAEVDIHPVPADKMSINGLSTEVEVMLSAGMTKAELVTKFFDTHTDPGLGDRIAGSFRTEYIRLKGLGLPPDTIFYELQKFAGGAERKVPAHEAAVLAVLAHFFEECDIFERSDMEDLHDTANQET